jgi:PAS domain S-box-containing protein
MEQVIDFFTKLFGTESWPARWFCGEWTAFHGWLYICSDLAIWGAYFTIPVFLTVFVLKRKDLPFHGLFWLFGAFIVACGTTHLFDALAFWWPAYRLNGLIRFITAVVSWITVFALIKVIPQAMALRSPKELEREVRQRKRAEELLRVKQQQLLDAQAIANIGSWEWDILTNKVVWTDELYRIFGLQPQQTELNYERVQQLHHPDDSKQLAKAVERAMETKEPYQLYLRLQRENGEERIVHARGEVVTDEQGRVIRLLGTTQDVTALKATETALEKKAAELERSNAELEQFAYVASHDLQEPLRKIRTFGERLSTKCKDNLDENGQAYLESMLNASARMQELIDDLLQYSRVTREHQEFVPTDLNHVLAGVLDDLQVNIEQQKAEITVGRLPVVNAIPGQMRQLFQNLLSNALKFHAVGKPPVVKISAESITIDKPSLTGRFAQSGSYWRIIVADNGIGFDEQYLEKMFVAFQRLHGREKYKGTGIGLAVCQKIVEHHGGRITARGTLDKGSVFIVDLPIPA